MLNLLLSVSTLLGKSEIQIVQLLNICFVRLRSADRCGTKYMIPRNYRRSIYYNKNSLLLFLTEMYENTTNNSSKRRQVCFIIILLIET